MKILHLYALSIVVVAWFTFGVWAVSQSIPQSFSWFQWWFIMTLSSFAAIIISSVLIMLIFDKKFY